MSNNTTQYVSYGSKLPWILAALLTMSGLLIYWVTDPKNIFFDNTFSANPYRNILFGLFLFGSITLVFSLAKCRFLWSLAFSLICGLILGAIMGWNSLLYAQEFWFLFDHAFTAGVFALLLSIPFFQTYCNRGVARPTCLFSYEKLYFYAWTNILIAGTSLVFLCGSWLLLYLIASLFSLIGIDAVETLIEQELFAFTFSGAMLGASIGLLRESEKILGTLQSVVQLVLSILSPLLALALLIFLASLCMTSLDSLWEATRITTPIMLSCAASAVLLINAVIRDNNKRASNSRILIVSAIVLAITLLPITGIAAISTSLRIQQYGLSPERLWAVVTIAIAIAYAIAYLLCVVRYTKQRFEKIRSANTVLALSVCVLALFLALPIVDFGALSAQHQLKRLESGAVSPENFDYVALKYDFGPTGGKVLNQLTQSNNTQIADIAKQISSITHRINSQEIQQYRKDLLRFKEKLFIYPKGNTAPKPLLQEVIMKPCFGKHIACLLYFMGSDLVLLQVLRERDISAYSIEYTYFYRLEGSSWHQSHEVSPDTNQQRQYKIDKKELAELKEHGNIEIRQVTRRQLFINGKPVSETFE